MTARKIRMNWRLRDEAQAPYWELKLERDPPISRGELKAIQIDTSSQRRTCEEVSGERC